MSKLPGRKLVLGSSRAMKDLYERIAEIAPTRMSVLLLGESGTGKERVAHAIHESSERRDGPFIPVNCAGFTDGTADSELFGHARGAFTGASDQRRGLVASADKGTIFLDEFADLSSNVQVKMLRMFENGEIRSVGADKVQTVNVRFIAATSADIDERMQSGSLRRDLLNRFEEILVLPPLRERTEDIAELAQHFVAIHRGEEGLNPKAETISTKTLEILARHSWPGNVRELETAVKIALRRSKASEATELEPSHFRLEAVRPAPLQESLFEVALEAEAARVLAALKIGEMEPVTIDELARRYASTPMKLKLVELFEREYPAADRDQAARKLFGYVDADSVRKFRRQYSAR
jgi:DNA-binding NtrC family response regulator